MRAQLRVLLAGLLVSCAPDRWAVLQPDWEEPDPAGARSAVEVPGELVPEQDNAPAFELPAGEAPVELSIEQATMLAIGHNRDLAVRQLGPVVAGAFEQIERGRFDPEAYVDFAYGEESATEVSRSTGEQFGVEGSDRSLAAGVRQELPTGTTIDLGFEQERTDSDRTPTQESARLGLTITQALLRGRGPAVNLAGVRQAELETLASVYELHGYTQALVADTQVAYWNFVLSHEEIAIFEESLEVARRQLDEVRQRIEVGVLPKTELAVARTEVALREQALVDARARLEERRLRLLQLISPELRGVLDRTVLPVSEARIDPRPIDDVADRLELANTSRPDLREARLRQEQNRLETVVTRNGVLPRLDLFVTLGKTGYADTFLDSLGDLDGPGYDFSVGLSLSQALGNRSARGRDLAARASWRQAAEAVANLEQIVLLDVCLAVNEVERARRQIAATAATRAAQEETVAAERERYEVGASTGLLVAQAQRDLLVAQIEEVRAVVNYRIALVRLYLAEGSLLDRRGIRLEAPVE
jgi:outer membrane protein TolC